MVFSDEMYYVVVENGASIPCDVPVSVGVLRVDWNGCVEVLRSCGVLEPDVGVRWSVVRFCVFSGGC